MWETWVQSLCWEDLLEKEMATHSNTLAWEIPWTEEPGGLQSMELQRVRHDWATSLHWVCYSFPSKEQTSFNFLLQSPSTVILELKKKKICHCFHFFSVYLLWSDGIGYHGLRFFNVESQANIALRQKLTSPFSVFVPSFCFCYFVFISLFYFYFSHNSQIQKASFIILKIQPFKAPYNTLKCSILPFWVINCILVILFIFIFCLCHTVYGVLVPWPGIKPVPPTLEPESLN